MNPEDYYGIDFEFPILKEKITAAGLLEPRNLPYAISTAVAVGGLFGSFFAVTKAKKLQWVILSGIVAGYSSTQVGLSGHDAGHFQVFGAKDERKKNAALQFGLATTIGFSRVWWTIKHNMHHAWTNILNKDPDIEYGLLIFSPEQLKTRNPRLFKLLRIQHWMLLLYFPLQALNAQYSSFRYVLKAEDREARITRWVLAVREVLYLLFLIKMGKKGAIFGLFHMAVFGIYNAFVFAPNHKGMPVLSEDQMRRLGYPLSQALTSRDVAFDENGPFNSLNPVIDTAGGGLGSQIAHHLFPRMSRFNLPKARKIVREHCEERGIPFEIANPLDSYTKAIGWLYKVAKMVPKGKNSPRSM